MYPFTRAKRLQLRQEESLDGRGVRNRGWLAGQFRGEHERGHRTHTTVETPDYIYGGNLYVHRSADRVACLPRQFGQGPSSSVETYPLNQGQISIFTEEVLKLAMSKGQITAWELYNIATEIYKPGKTDFPALIPQNGAMAELLLSRLPEELEVQDAVQVN